MRIRTSLPDSPPTRRFRRGRHDRGRWFPRLINLFPDEILHARVSSAAADKAWGTPVWTEPRAFDPPDW